jgi:photosystem II stability/assembly factor-like uncharacterized protein
MLFNIRKTKTTKPRQSPDGGSGLFLLTLPSPRRTIRPIRLSHRHHTVTHPGLKVNTSPKRRALVSGQTNVIGEKRSFLLESASWLGGTNLTAHCEYGRLKGPRILFNPGWQEVRMRVRWFGVFCSLFIMALPLHGTTSPLGGGPAGGNIRALAIDPSNPNIIYAGSWVCCGLAATTYEQTLKGGIFKTTNGGQSWIALSNGLPDDAVDSLAVDPKNPSTVYAATFANGVFKTTDGGQSWNAMNAGLTNLFATGVAVDPNNSSTVYAETQSTGGFFKSTNGGQSWASVNLGFNFDQVTSLAFDLTNPLTMYIGASGATSDGSTGFFKTTDGGQSWILTNAGLIQPPVGGGILVSAITIDPTNPAVLYVAGGSIFKSADGGQSWTLMALRLGVSSILVDPSQPATLYAAGISGFFKSTDAGASWVSLNTGFTDTEVQALIMSPAAPSTLYAATANDGVFKTADGGQLWASASAGITARIVGALAVDPSNSATLYAGSGASLFKTTDSGTTWIPLSAIDPGQKLGVQVGFLSLAIDPTARNTVYAGGYIASGVLKSTDGGQSWVAGLTSPFPSNVLSLAIDSTAPSTVYATSGSLGVDKSTDGGQSWIESIFPGFGHQAVTAIVIDPNDATIVYAAALGGAIFKSTDGALSWTPVLTGDSFWSLVALPTLPKTTLYAGSSTGTVYKSTDGGVTWSALLSGFSDSQGNLVSVRTLAVPASTPTTIYAGTFGAGIFKSTDGGQTWNAINAGLPNLRILRLVVDPASPAIIYAATSGAGVFKSTNGGQSWQGTEPPPGTGTPAISVSPAQITFPPTLVNTTSAPVTVTINNPGTAALLISDISTQNPPFAITNPSPNIGNVPPGGHASFDVIFSPTGPGPFSGNLTILSNAPALRTVIPLQGTVLPHVSILFTNDVHGTWLKTMEDGNTILHRIALEAGVERQKNPDGVLLMDAGDLVYSTGDSVSDYSTYLTAMRDDAGYNIVAVGNHDFFGNRDFGFDWDNPQKLTAGVASAQATGLHPGLHVASENLHALAVQQASANQPWIPYEQQVEPLVTVVRNGLKVGILGLTAPKNYGKVPIYGVPFDTLLTESQMAASVSSVVATQRSNVDILIALTHIDFNGSDFKTNPVTGCLQLVEPIGTELKALGQPIDVAICGHDHIIQRSEPGDLLTAQFLDRGDGRPSYAFEAGSQITCTPDSPFAASDFPFSDVCNSVNPNPSRIPRPMLGKVELAFRNGTVIVLSKNFIDLGPKYHATFDGRCPEPSKGKPLPIQQGQTVTLRATFRNLGTRTWFNSPANSEQTKVRLGIVNPRTAAPNFSLPFVYDSGDALRPANLLENSVPPGKIGTFIFKLTVPPTTKTKIYRLRVAPVAEASDSTQDWMNRGDTVDWDIQVTQPQATPPSSSCPVS